MEHIISKRTLQAWDQTHGIPVTILRLPADGQMTINILIYTGRPGRNVPDFGRMFLKLKYTDITRKTYIRS